MKKLLLITMIATLMFCFGCQTLIYGSASQLNDLQIGMSQDEVYKVIGSPVATHADRDKKEVHLIYKKMKHPISMWARTYDVTLRDGKVVKWGEQYDEKNLNVEN